MATLTQPYGITLPISHGPQGYFNQSYSILEQIKSNLNLLFRTKKGERRRNPEFGSGLWSVLFENYTDDITPLIENTIRKDVTRWMPYVNIDSIQVSTNTTENNDKYRIYVKVLYTVPSIGEMETQILEVNVNAGNI
jgi:phage baseplate assembly protein W